MNSSTFGILPTLAGVEDFFKFKSEFDLILNNPTVRKNTIIYSLTQEKLAFGNEEENDVNILDQMTSANLVLVDCHVLNDTLFENNPVEAIFDHRPIDSSFVCKKDTYVVDDKYSSSLSCFLYELFDKRMNLVNRLKLADAVIGNSSLDLDSVGTVCVVRHIIEQAKNTKTKDFNLFIEQAFSDPFIKTVAISVLDNDLQKKPSDENAKNMLSYLNMDFIPQFSRFDYRRKFPLSPLQKLLADTKIYNKRRVLFSTEKMNVIEFFTAIDELKNVMPRVELVILKNNVDKKESFAFFYGTYVDVQNHVSVQDFVCRDFVQPDTKKCLQVVTFPNVITRKQFGNFDKIKFQGDI